MNWTGKFFIILSCSIALTLSSTPSLLAARTPPTTVAKVKTATVKKSIAKRGRTRQTQVVTKVKTSTIEKKKLAKVSPPRVKQAKRRAPAIKTQTTEARLSSGARLTVTQQVPPSVYVVQKTIGTLPERITARSAMVMDATTGAAIYAQASDVPAQPASTIKVLTGVISLDALQKNELVEVSRRAAMMPKSKIYLNAGKKYPANDLINAVLLASANDASVALAEKIGGSEEGFARLMTAKARSFGATNTVCKTANGLTARGQHTTAHDLAKIFNNAMRNNEFASKMAVTEVENTDGKIIKSHNRALWQLEGAEGGKTGYTDAARKTYVGKFKRDNDEIVVALMGSENMWGDLKKLVEYGFAKKRSLNMAATPTKKSGNSSRLLVQAVNAPRRLPVVNTF